MTVHVLDAFGPKLVGLHVNAEGAEVVTRLIVAFLVTPLRVALTVTLWLWLRVPVVAFTVAELAPAATLAEAGTVSAPLVLESATEDPPVGAA